MSCYYDEDLAWVHDTAYGGHADRAAPGILRLLRAGGVRPGALVVDVGCGSGILAGHLLAAGYTVHGIDASAAMIALARARAPGASFGILALPMPDGDAQPTRLPAAEAVVSTGHALNYIDGREGIALALRQIAAALRPGGVLALDLLTERFRDMRDLSAAHARVEEDWAIVTRFSRPLPSRFDREITVFRRTGTAWRRTDEHHRNFMFDPEEAIRILSQAGVDATIRPAFGDEALPEGMVVVTGRRR